MLQHRSQTYSQLPLRQTPCSRCCRRAARGSQPFAPTPNACVAGSGRSMAAEQVGRDMSAWVHDIRLVGARHTSCSSWWTRSISSHAVASAAAYTCSGARRRVPGGRSRGLALSAQPACSILVKRESSRVLRSQHSPTAPIVLLCSYSSLSTRLPIGFVDHWRRPRRLQCIELLFLRVV